MTPSRAAQSQESGTALELSDFAGLRWVHGFEFPNKAGTAGPGIIFSGPLLEGREMGLRRGG